MNKKQEDFCHHYAVSGNGLEAAIKAGYSKRTAMQQASRLLRNVKLKQKIAEIREDALTELKIESRDVIRELALIAFSSIGDVIEIDSDGELKIKPDADLSGVKGLSASATETSRSFSIKLHDKLGALRELAKITGVYENSGNNSIDRESTAKRILESLRKFTSDRDESNKV